MRTRSAIIIVTATTVALLGCGSDDGIEAAPSPQPTTESAPDATPEPTPTEAAPPDPLDECALLSLDELATIDNALHQDPKIGFRMAGETPTGWHVSCGYVRADAEIGPSAPTWLRITTETEEFVAPHGFADDDLPMSEAEPVDDLGDEAYAVVHWDRMGEPVPNQATVKALTGSTTVELSVRNQYGDADDPELPDLDTVVELVRLAIDRLPEDIVVDAGEPSGDCRQIDLGLAAAMLDGDLTTARTVIDGDDAGCHFTGREGDRQHNLSVLRLTGAHGDEVWGRWSGQAAPDDLTDDAVYLYSRDAGTVSIRTDDVYLQVRASNLHHQIEELTAEHLAFLTALADELG
jgi:hypothetical protein